MANSPKGLQQNQVRRPAQIDNFFNDAQGPEMPQDGDLNAS